MEELGHEFFVFVNAETERVDVLYRRQDGDFGLIEPVVGGDYTKGRRAGAGAAGRTGASRSRPSRSAESGRSYGLAATARRR